MVPVINIVLMGVSALIAIGLPVGLFLFWRRRKGLKLMPLLAGAAVFIVFSLVLESLLHSIVLAPDPLTGAIALKSQPVLYVLYGCLAAGIFEETGRFLAFLLLRKRYSGVGTALSYGIGHGGIEAVLLVGLSMVSSIAIAVMINTGGTDVVALLGPTGPEVVDSLVSTSTALFLISGFERVFAIAIQISLSVIVWYAVTTKGKLWLYPAAILLHALIDVAAAVYQTGAALNIYLVEGSVAAAAVIVAVLAWLVHKKYKVAETPEPIAPESLPAS
jgi:uncharacterized membrane protein YhfC